MPTRRPFKGSGPRSYDDYLQILEKAGGYCTDPIGKCLRERSAIKGIPKKDIQLCIRDSETYEACTKNDRLSARFDPSRAQTGWLIWIEYFRPQIVFWRPLEVAVDWASGVFRQVGTDCYGCISDVRNCLYAQPTRKERMLSPAIVANAIVSLDAEADIAALRDELEREDPSTREALIQARRGQGRYRDDLLSLWAKKCAVSKCAILPLLRASHIKPWRSCTSHGERLDRYNGLLLAPNLDASFDRGLISFDDDGNILISPRVPPPDAKLLGLEAKQRLVYVFEENKPYLAFHRQLYGF
jgi:hypothetical protein